MRPQARRGRQLLGRPRRFGEEGQVLPALLLLMVALAVGGVLLLQVGAGADLRARAQTSADAAALAGARELRSQLLMQVAGTGTFGGVVDEAAIAAAADDYARRNGGRVTSYRRVGFDVLVAVETLDALGPEARPIDSEGSRATARARARLTPAYSLGVAPQLTGGGSGVPEDELRELAEKAGLDYADIHPSSALRVYGSDCFAGVDVVHLHESMKIAILQAEALLGGPLVLNDGYRTYACQAHLFATVTGPVAPPGQSMHNYGMAIDVGNYGALASVAGQVGLCQPLPANDAVHFSVASGPECGGRSGTLGPGGAFGGNVGGFVTFEIRLVDLAG